MFVVLVTLLVDVDTLFHLLNYPEYNPLFSNRVGANHVQGTIAILPDDVQYVVLHRLLGR